MKRLYALRDKKAEVFGPLMEFLNDAVAVRAFGETLQDKATTVARYPADFELVFLGTFSPEHRHPDSVSPVVGFGPLVIITGEQWVAAQRAQEGES